jgi:hypothetical protein
MNLRKMKHFLLPLLCLWGPVLLVGQMALTAPAADEGIQLQHSRESITIDGDLREAAWYTGRSATDFWENFPSDTARCSWKTEIFMTYDEEFLYIGARCYAPGKDYIVPSLRRDYQAGGSDNITFLIDPFRDRTNAFVFGMNPYGVMREALISNGGRSTDDWLAEWDNKWKGESAIFDDYWSCEIAIPFSTIRFPEGEKSWNFNSYRFDTQSNTRSTWQPIPQNQIIMSLAYMGNMTWEEAPAVAGKSISIIPFLAGGVARNHEEGLPSETDFSFGGDAKIAITSGLNLDLTINPDFSQVEVDQQVINLDRFEVFFPERRQFFLENSDLFGTFGDDLANPFFSRRIGVATNAADEAFPTPIYYGARLSGKLDNNWRIGLLNMQTARDEDNNLPSYNYTVAALQRKVFSRSNIGVILVNKQNFGDNQSDTTTYYSDFNRVLGIDYNLASADNHWLGKFYFHHSFSPVQGVAPYSHGARIDYRERRFAFGLEERFVGEEYNAEVGFVPRINYFQINPRAELFFYPRKGGINRHGPSIRTRYLWTPEEGSTDRRTSLSWGFSYANNSNLNFSATHEYVYLLDPFDPSGTEATELPGQQGYQYTFFSAEYRSDQRKKFSYGLEPSVGEFFNGHRYGISTNLTWRYQPLGQIALTTNYNYIDLPAPYASTSLFLIGPRIDLTFTKNIFLTAFFQFNDQIDNVNINTRLQWRFAPVSDFFLVYTDNYNSLDWNVKNRSLVAKLTYWLNT